MDHIQDLTERAVSLITFMQDTIVEGTVHNGHPLPSTGILEVFGPGFATRFTGYVETVKACQRKSAEALLQNGVVDTDYAHKFLGIERKVIELVWFSDRSPATIEKDKMNRAEEFLLAVCRDLSVWISRNAGALTQKQEELFDAFATPQTWRQAISRRLYQSAKERVQLAEDLEYLPIQVVLALGGCGYGIREQRILQWWQTGKKEAAIPMTEEELAIREKFFEVCHNSFYDERQHTKDRGAADQGSLQLFYQIKTKELLANYSYVIERLLKREAPLSFPYIFAGELDEIQKNRELRYKECVVTQQENIAVPPKGASENGVKNVEAPEDSHEQEKDCNPVATAQEMGLFALAFSGGGIRSATFNLGILQGLSKKCVLSHVDYLSTVSGGGYIGSWLATWIKRSGSLSKVQGCLNADASPDPLGEEVRPIRWLRMFSNYLAPEKSIMSLDSWTIGVTWLRNMLLNQVVILMVLLALMLVFRLGFDFWHSTQIWGQRFMRISVYVTAILLLGILAYLTGLGMQWYNKGPQASPTTRLEQKQTLTSLIVIIAVAGAFMVSASMYAAPKETFWYFLKGKLPLLLPAAFVTFLILLTIARIGRYDRCIRNMEERRSAKQVRWRPSRILIGTALLAATVGWLALAGTWKLLELLADRRFVMSKTGALDGTELAFTVGVPLVLLVFGVTVVARMAFLGKYFPDERREWWGRMGAVINRIALLWLLLGASITVLDDVLKFLVGSWNMPASIGGWIALVGGAVKAASSGKTTGKTETKGFEAIMLDWFSKAAPYLFALGLLIFLPHLADALLKKDLHVPVLDSQPPLKALFYVIALSVAALYLSTRLGVNEFSMHHFYRNRLVRAYLGASRARTIREKTVNPFTGFDGLDDEKLSLFRNCQGYYGPYPVLNTALNASQVTDLSRQDRKAESFIFSPLYSGFDFSQARSSANQVVKSYDFGYRPTSQYGYPKGPGIGTAMAISGAAANPNMGYHSSAGTAFLLTVFNVQLGWWTGNPRKSKWKQSDPSFGLAYVFYNMTGQTNTRNDFVCLSDGGHFDNMGLYEMVRRRCAVVVVCDGEQDENLTCEGLANAIRRCRIDFGAEINIDTEDIVKRDGRFSKQHYALGTICYKGERKPTGTLLYVKASITGDEPVDVKEYALKNDAFPHQTTSDQYFDEQQFESYRKLGMHIADKLLKDQTVVDVLKLNFRVATDNKIETEPRTNQRKPYLPKLNFARQFYKRYS